MCRRHCCRWDEVEVCRASPRSQRQRYRVTRPPTAAISHLLSRSPIPLRSAAPTTTDDDQLLPALVHATPHTEDTSDTSPTTLWIETLNFHQPPEQSDMAFIGAYRRTSSFWLCTDYFFFDGLWLIRTTQISSTQFNGLTVGDNAVSSLALWPRVVC